MLFLPKVVLLKINFYREDHYGGCGIFICKSFPCISNMVETNCDRICAVLSEFTSFTILFISVYMPCDTYNNTYEFNSVLSVIQI